MHQKSWIILNQRQQSTTTTQWQTKCRCAVCNRLINFIWWLGKISVQCWVGSRVVVSVSNVSVPRRSRGVFSNVSVSSRYRHSKVSVSSRSRHSTSRYRLGLGIIRLVYIEFQISNITKNLYSIEILGRLSISAEIEIFVCFWTV